MVFDYIKGIIFIPIFIYILANLGKKIAHNESFGANLFTGYVVYTFFQFIGGFLAQQFRLPWIVYQIYMIVLLIVLLAFSLYKNKIELNKAKLKTHFRTYGVLYFIAFVFIILAMFNIQFLWNGNNVDDGYYLNKIRMAPYVENYVDYNFAVGVPAEGSIIRNVNTYEIEAAFFSQLLGIDASIYAKFVLALINYILVVHGVYYLFENIGGKKYKNLAYAVIPILFFGIYYNLQTNFHLLTTNDGWQFNTAMWYGSTLVKTIGLILMLLPLLKEHFTYKSFILYGFLIVTLMSKASQTFPLVIITALIFVLKQGMRLLRNKFGIRYGLLLLIVVLIILFFIPMTDAIEHRAFMINELLSSNAKLLVFKGSLFLVALSYLLDNKILKKWNNLLLTFGFFIFMPKINTLFLYASIYDFVASRTLELYLYTLIFTACLIFFIGLTKMIRSQKSMKVLYVGIAFVFVAIPMISVQRNLGIINTVSILLDNPRLLPETTVELSESLSNLSKEKNKKLNVLTPMWIVMDGTPHSTASFVQYNAYDQLVSIGVMARYNEMTENSIFKGISQDDVDIFEKYNSGEDRDDKKLEKFLDKYPVDCIVVVYDDVAKKLEEHFGYKVVDRIMLSDKYHYYNILYKE